MYWKLHAIHSGKTFMLEYLTNESLYAKKCSDILHSFKWIINFILHLKYFCCRILEIKDLIQNQITTQYFFFILLDVQ